MLAFARNLLVTPVAVQLDPPVPVMQYNLGIHLWIMLHHIPLCQSLTVHAPCSLNVGALMSRKGLEVNVPFSVERKLKIQSGVGCGSVWQE